MKFKCLGLMFAGILFVAAPVQAAPVLNVSGGTNTTIGAAIGGSGFDLGAETGLGNGSAISVFDSISGGAPGLSVSEAAKVTFEFLGSEAGFTNTFTAPAGSFTNIPAPGTTLFSANVVAGLVDFVLSTTGGGGGSATNGGAISPNLSYAISVVDATTVIVLFDDGGVATDFDDLAVKVSVSQVPLPAAAWLLISAILGLVSFARIRRNGAQTA